MEPQSIEPQMCTAMSVLMGSRRSMSLIFATAKTF